MAASISNTNGFKPMSALRKAAADPRVDEIEGGGMDDGRVFIHFKNGWAYPYPDTTHSRSVGSAQDVKYALSEVKPCSCKQCAQRAA